MKKLIPTFILLSLLASLHAQKTIDITYIADAGFLITNDTSKLLIDGIFNEGYGFYYTPTAQTLTKERNAAYPFNDINVILNTHAHDDHINPAYLTEHMINDNNAVLLAPYLSVNRLKSITGYNSIKNRIREITQTNQSKLDTTIDGIKIKSMEIRHVDSAFLPTLNLGYVFEMNGIKVFHPGDADSANLSLFQNLDLANDSIDIALIPYWFFLTNTGINIVNYLNPKAIIIMHVMVPNQTYNYAYVKNRIKSLTGIPPIYFMEQPMEDLAFVKQNDSIFTFNESDSAYLGQTPPGDTRKIFNLAADPGYIATERIAISPDGKEIYYEETNHPSWNLFKIRYYKYYDNQWNGPFNLFNGYYCLALSPDGNHLYMENNSCTDGWIAERNDTGWDTPYRIIENFDVHSLNITSNGNYYLSSNPEGGLGGLDISRLIITSSDTTMEGLGLPLNSNNIEGDFTISNDESFIIFMSDRSGGYGGTDLYISFMKSDDTWTSPQNMGPSVNTANDDFGPYITGDNKFLFYASGYNGPCSIYWIKVDDLIDSLKQNSVITNIMNTELSEIPVTVFPNPSSDFLYIQLGQLQNVPTRVEIITLAGQVVYTYTIKSDEAIDVSGMQKGAYIVKITDAYGKTMAKTIIFN